MNLKRIAHPWSIRKRLILLILAVFLPLAGIVLFQGMRERTKALDDAAQYATTIVESLAAQQGRIEAGTRQMLSTLAQLPEVQSLKAEVCDDLFRKITSRYKYYSNVALSTPDGNMVAGSHPFEPGSVNVSDRKHIKEAIKELRFAAGGYVVGRTSNLPSIHYAYPVIDSNNKLIAVITAGFNLTEYESFIRKVDPPPDSAVVISDYKGVRLYRFPESPAAPLGHSVTAGYKQTKGLEEGVIDRMCGDGIYRIIAFKWLSLSDSSPPYILISVGVSKDRILQKANSAMKFNLLILCLAAGILLSIAWFLGNIVFTRPINVLVDAANRLAEGNMGARTGLSHTPDELGKLAKSFDNMAELLERRGLEKKKAQEQLLSAHRHSQLILNTAQEGIVGVDEKGTVTFANAAALATLGYEEGELIGRDLHPAIHHSFPDGAPYPEAECPMSRSLRGDASCQVRNEFLWKKDGAGFPAAYTTASIMENGKVVGAVLTFRDISVRKLAEEALRESENKFKSFSEHAISGIYLIEDGVFRYVNPKFAEMFGYTVEELQDLMPFTRLVCTEDSAKVEQQVGRRISGEADSVHYTFRGLRKNGQVFHVEIYGTGTLHNGKPAALGTILDITERRRTEEALRESEERYRLLFGNIQDAVFVNLVTEEGTPGHFIEVNEIACRKLGYTREELLQMSPFDIDAPDTRAFIPRIMEELRQHGHATWEGAHLTRDGQRIPVEINNRLFDLGGAPMILATVRDVTERKRAEKEQAILQEQLNQAQKLESVGRLAGGVAHDFNNMLGVILGHAEIAMEKIDQANALFEDLTEIRKAALRSADLTRQLLAFARRQTISPKILDLNETVEGMLKMLRRLIGEDIDLAWLPETNLWPVKVDPGQIDQLLANLCVNARDAISGIGKVTIETGAACFDKDYCSRHPGFSPGEFVMLAVSDNGCGMEKETMSNIFEPFFTTKAFGEGTGLGLATVYGIVRQNNGFINVYSEPGEGTTFKIYLPRAGEQTTQQPPVDSKKDLRGDETVLLVEDEESILTLGKTILQRYGYEVLATKSPTEALGMIQNYPGPIHLLIIDVVMPEMNGKDIRDKLVEFKPDLKTMFMSGYTANVIAHHGILDEGIDFLQKPFSVNTLLEKVRSVLDG